MQGSLETTVMHGSLETAVMHGSLETAVMHEMAPPLIHRVAGPFHESGSFETSIPAVSQARLALRNSGDVEEVDHSRLEGVLGADDEESVVLDQPLEHRGAVTQVIDGRTVFDWILSAAAPRDLLAEPDVYWVEKGGYSPAKFLREE